MNKSENSTIQIDPISLRLYAQHRRTVALKRLFSDLGNRAKIAWRRVAIRKLSNQQLTDAAIDFPKAGPGKSAAAQIERNMETRS